MMAGALVSDEPVLPDAGVLLMDFKGFCL